MALLDRQIHAAPLTPNGTRACLSQLRRDLVIARIAAGIFGNAGYNSLRSLGHANSDANMMSCGVIMREKHKIDLRLELFNVLNHTSFQPPFQKAGLQCSA
jgi:hypothetical protein